MLLNPFNKLPVKYGLECAFLATTTALVNAASNTSFDDDTEAGMETLKSTYKTAEQITEILANILNAYTEMRLRDNKTDLQLHQEKLNPGQLLRDEIENLMGEDQFHEQSFTNGLLAGAAYSTLCYTGVMEKLVDTNLPDMLTKLLGSMAEFKEIVQLLDSDRNSTPAMTEEMRQMFIKMMQAYCQMTGTRMTPEDQSKLFECRIHHKSGNMLRVREIGLDEMNVNKHSSSTYDNAETDLFLNFNNCVTYSYAELVDILNLYRGLLCTITPEQLNERFQYYADHLDEINQSKAQQALESGDLMAVTKGNLMKILDYMEKNTKS